MKPESGKIYVVTLNDYSRMAIIAAYASREEAERIAATTEDADVVELELGQFPEEHWTITIEIGDEGATDARHGPYIAYTPIRQLWPVWNAYGKERHLNCQVPGANLDQAEAQAKALWQYVTDHNLWHRREDAIEETLRKNRSIFEYINDPGNAGLHPAG